MANAKIIEQKAGVVSEIKERLENAKSVVMFDYRGLSVSEVTELRRKLREVGTDELSIVKVISDFAKEHNALELKTGIVEGKVASLEDLKRYASIPSRDTLLTMLAAGMMGTVRDLSICLDLYSKEKENN